jgi:hypothetical protein
MKRKIFTSIILLAFVTVLLSVALLSMALYHQQPGRPHQQAEQVYKPCRAEDG